MLGSAQGGPGRPPGQAPRSRDDRHTIRTGSEVRAARAVGDLRRALTPLAVDVAIPLGSYYLAHSAFGLSTVNALIISSVIPAVRTVTGLLRQREWNALAATSLRFRRVEKAFTLIWGCRLLADCVARFVGAVTLPVATMAWLGTVILLGAVGAGIVAGGIASQPTEKLVREAAMAKLDAGGADASCAV